MPFRQYVAELQRNLKGRHTERTFYPALQRLLEELNPSVDVVTEAGHVTEVGNPDFEIRNKGKATDFRIGWLEAKEPGEDLDAIAKSEQLKRYARLHNLVLTDFVEFRWFRDGKQILSARLGQFRDGKLRPDPKAEAEVRQLLEQFLTWEFAAPRSPKELAERMAGLAHVIRDLTLNTFNKEAEDGELHAQYEAFKQTLIPDLKPEQFADMYAQTIAYGLFAAACQPRPATERFSREKAAYLIPRTNPFLRKLFSRVAGPELDDRLKPFVDHLAALLDRADLGSILADFGKRTGREDPVVHFYEDFLQEYDPKVREMRGVYYTPEPVVSYIVRSIDHLLKTRFDKPDGLADDNVLILDPACGTGTFLYYVIRHIYDHQCTKGQKGAWNSYVSENLLKRIFGFELLMAPYAVAHLKLALQLQELGYNFDTDERLGIYLTNSLEEVVKHAEQLLARWITEEAAAADEIKKKKPIMVVLGNPPYSGHSANRSWVETEVVNPKTKKKTKKKTPTFIGRLLQDYYKVDGKPLGERNPKWLQDDYVKFIRFAQWRIERTGVGVVGLITNHSYLDNPTFRGMRQSLMTTFSELFFLDLHGGFRKGEVAPGGGPDKNVFDIQQGVAIALLSRREQGETMVNHAETWGTRESKQKLLSESAIDSAPWTSIRPQAPQYLFVPGDTTLEEEYKKGWSLKDAFGLECLGIQTHRDGVSVDFRHDELLDKLAQFSHRDKSDDQVSAEFGVKSTRDWDLSAARRYLQEIGIKPELAVRYAYRPFDWRVIYYTNRVIEYERSEVMPHLIRSNLALNTMRQTKCPKWRHAWVTNSPTDAFVVEIKDGATTFPLYLYDLGALTSQMPGGQTSRRANLVPEFASQFGSPVGLRFIADGRGNLKEDFGPEDILAYVYAVLWAPSYQTRYGTLLRRDFPRVPLTSDKKLFRALVEKGRELVSLHLLESPKVNDFITRYEQPEQPGGHAVEKVWYDEKKKRVYINKTQYFEGVPKEVWEFHIGGYQVCEKWLKDRQKAERKLSSDDIDHYQKIVVALNETIRLMREIDEIIPGWPLP